MSIHFYEWRYLMPKWLGHCPNRGWHGTSCWLHSKTNTRKGRSMNSRYDYIVTWLKSPLSKLYRSQTGLAICTADFDTSEGTTWKRCCRHICVGEALPWVTASTAMQQSLHLQKQRLHIWLLLVITRQCGQRGVCCHAGLPDLLFAKGANLVQKRAKKEPNSYTRGQKRPTIFPILTAITKLYEPILSNLWNSNVPQSQM